MRRLWPLIILFWLIAGCATYKGPGSETWHAQRIAELDAAYKNNEISQKEYFSLRNEIDSIRSNYEQGENYTHPYTSFHYGYFHH